MLYFLATHPENNLTGVCLDVVLRGESDSCCLFRSKFSSFRPLFDLLARSSYCICQDIILDGRFARWRVIRPGEQIPSEHKQKHTLILCWSFEIWSYAMSCPQPKKYCVSCNRKKMCQVGNILLKRFAKLREWVAIK